MTSELSYALDPVRWARECLHFTPDPWQARVLESDNNLLLNVCRQAGKSTTCGVLALHRATYFPKSLILVLSPSIRQSSELYRKISDFMTQLDHPPKLEEDNRLSCVFRGNGSRIVSLPGTERTIRGYSGVSLIILDEASRIPDELYYSVRPMLAVSGGRMVMMSTPFGRRGVFFEAYVNGSLESWERLEIPADKCPRITPEFLDEERKTLGDWWFSQEYECVFRDTTDQVFSWDLVKEALDDSLEPLFPLGIDGGVNHHTCLPSPIDESINPIFRGGDHEVWR
jgi:hypothetical protein